ncbi:MAG: RNA polymerase sigma-70 factor [Rikenellaceae bacterium]|nr:RNA polymerase sigma-70 factor [Rikenellaceae bacterium]
MKQSPNLTLTVEDTSEVVDLYRRRFVRVALNYARDEEAAEDIVSDSFLAYWENRGKLPADTNVAGYIMATVKNRCLNWLKQQKVHARVEKNMSELQRRVLLSSINSLESGDPGHIFDREVQNIIDRQLASMPELTRRIFLASRHESKTHKEIAFEMKLHPRKVNYELQKALALFRAVLKDYFIIIFILLNR